MRLPLIASDHGTLRLDQYFYDILRALVNTMAGFVWYLTAFLASTSVIQADVASAQYLLGLGECQTRQQSRHPVLLAVRQALEISLGK